MAMIQSTIRAAALVALAALAAHALPAVAQNLGVGSNVNVNTDANANSITITGRLLGSAAVVGFGEAPLARTPLQISVMGNGLLADAGVAQIGGLTRLDASVGDAYNAEGYWGQLAVRGYGLDNRFNYRRDGLPINAETAVSLANKDRVELIKGTSGVQAGTSAPGGLLNLVVKRPVAALRTATLEWREPGSVRAAVDWSDRFGEEGRFGLRINASAEQLSPAVRNTRGQRTLLALAGDWQLSANTLVQAEIESSHQRQPSVAGYSLLGNSVPAASTVDVRRNLNDQPWRQPVVLDGTTASLRLQQQLSETWRLTVHAMEQRLRSDDRTAFPYGVYDSNYDCPQWCDRFAPDGSFTYWQYISDNERRDMRNLALMLAGRLQTGVLAHSIEVGLLRSSSRNRFEDQVFDIAGTGRIDGSLQTPRSAGSIDANTNRDERSTEWFVRDAVRIGPVWQLWAGVRHTRLDRSSQRTSPDGDGSLRETDYDRTATTPWLAMAAQLSAKTLLYASWGRGLETDVAPNRSRYSNAGASLALHSRQLELGIKHGSDEVEAALTLFDIDRGQTADIGSCSAIGTCTRVIDGSARHRGIEAQWARALGRFTLQGSAMWLDAQRRGSQRAGVDGLRPGNVPAASLRMGVEFRPAGKPGLPSLSGLALQANLSAESNRLVLPDNESLRIPGWARLDLGARWQQAAGGSTVTWRLGLDNATNRRAWKESPYQFGHVYLYPLQPRTWRLSAQVAM
ncbi:MAG: TonB-dependent receptor plug domain-containing protein [Rubrivivax sp.]|nr:TonB-dependent receptor plug domain-containing protein [Rubrivivax sp.]